MTIWQELENTKSIHLANAMIPFLLLLPGMQYELLYGSFFKTNVLQSLIFAAVFGLTLLVISLCSWTIMFEISTGDWKDNNDIYFLALTFTSVSSVAICSSLVFGSIWLLNISVPSRTAIGIVFCLSVMIPVLGILFSFIEKTRRKQKNKK